MHVRWLPVSRDLPCVDRKVVKRGNLREGEIISAKVDNIRNNPIRSCC